MDATTRTSRAVPPRTSPSTGARTQLNADPRLVGSYEKSRWAVKRARAYIEKRSKPTAGGTV